MSSYIQLPRSALSNDVRQDPDLARLFLHIINKIDDNGISSIDTTELNKVYGWTRQRSRTLIRRLKATANLTAKSTAKSTAFIFENNTVTPNAQPQNQPRNQPHSQPQKTSELMPSLDFGEQKAPPKTTRFKKPTIEEINQYITEKGYNIDAQYFFDYYESNGWKRGNTKMASWKHTLSNWNRNNFNNGTSKKQFTDKYAARRGADAGNLTEADYGGTF